MPDPIKRREQARKGRKAKPTSTSRRRRLADLQRTRPQQHEDDPHPTGGEVRLDDLARRLYTELIRRRVLAGEPTDTLDAAACRVADWLRDNPREARVLARYHLGPGLGADIALPELPIGPDLGGLADLRAVLEHHGARSIGEPKLVPPTPPEGWAIDRNPVICPDCNRRKWLIRPTTATRQAALAERRVASIATRWLTDAGAPHACKV